MFLWKYSKIYCRKPLWLPVFYLSRSYSGIKNFTLRFYKILEDASKTLFRHVYWFVLLSVLDYKSCFILLLIYTYNWLGGQLYLTINICLSQWSQCVWLTAIPRLFYMSQPATVEDLTANPVFLYMGQLLYGEVLTLNQVIPKWVNGLGEFPWPHFQNSVHESSVEL